MLDGRPALVVAPARARWLYVFAHGAGAGMRHAFMQIMASALADRDVATVRWELPYMAAGRPRVDGPAISEAAVRATWLAARAQLGTLPMFAGGKSFGGRMTSRAHAAEPLPGLAGIVFLGFPLHPAGKPGPELERASERWRAGPERAEHLASAKGPLLFVQGSRDDLADLALLRPVVQRLGRRAKLHVVDDADHGFDVLVRSGRKHLHVIAEIADTVANWMDRAARVR